jgi:two-component system, OmpR family, sensor histidine kinase SenX3
VHGSGLGLALCRKIMQVHAGSIRIDASSPEGTTFLLSFPAPPTSS